MQAAVHYRFANSTEEELVEFNGPYISVADLKKTIIQQKGLGKKGGVDLKIKNEQTKEGEATFSKLLLIYACHSND